MTKVVNNAAPRSKIRQYVYIVYIYFFVVSFAAVVVLAINIF